MRALLNDVGRQPVQILHFDHVPSDGAGPVHGLYLRALFHGFLDVIFAEVDLSEIADSRNHGRGMEF